MMLSEIETKYFMYYKFRSCEFFLSVTSFSIRKMLQNFYTVKMQTVLNFSKKRILKNTGYQKLDYMLKKNVILGLTLEF